MPQVPKDEVRAKMLDAALEVFAARGFERASMSEIAERAGVATGNLYRYYDGKDALFAAAVPDAIARELERRLEASARSFSFLATEAPLADVTREANELLAFWVEHRLAVGVLLDRAAGTPHHGFADRFVERLVRWSIEEIRAHHPAVRIGAPARLVLENLFDNTRRTIAAILVSSPNERALREGVAAFRAYQVNGLRGFVRWLVA